MTRREAVCENNRISNPGADPGFSTGVSRCRIECPFDIGI